MHIETIAVHSGRKIDAATGAVSAPLHLSTTFESDTDGGFARGYKYSRDDKPNRPALETCLADLEGGTTAVAFSSGMAAISASIEALSMNHPGSLVLPQEAVSRAQAAAPGRMPECRARRRGLSGRFW